MGLRIFHLRTYNTIRYDTTRYTTIYPGIRTRAWGRKRWDDRGQKAKQNGAESGVPDQVEPDLLYILIGTLVAGKGMR
jgi:hypothetical protein